MAKNSSLPNNIRKIERIFENGDRKLKLSKGPAARNAIPILLMKQPMSPKEVSGKEDKVFKKNLYATSTRNRLVCSVGMFC